MNTQNTFTGAINTQTNNQLRVMSTPEWPVPYYQRAFRHPAHLEKYNGSINYVAAPLDDNHVVLGKQILMDQGNGYVVEAVEQDYDINTYKTSFKDSSQFSECYIDDMLDGISLVSDQNRKILDDFDLQHCLN